MSEVRFALREDPSTICMLEDGEKHFNNYCQITAFARNIVRSEYLGKYMYFAPITGINGKFKGKATDIRIYLEDNDIIPKSNYVVTIDSEVEFSVNSSVISHLSHEYMPAWGVKAYLDYFADRPSGVLLFLRVYKVNKFLDSAFLEKGGKGKHQIFKLYDEFENDISVSINDIEPVISDNKFAYVKEAILHLLKVDNSFIAAYDTSKHGLINLDERIEADRLIRNYHRKSEKEDYSIDNDDDYDMAQLDYDNIFDKVESIYPSMKQMLDYARSIQPARKGEYDYLLKDILNNEDNIISTEMRIFDMSIRSAIKNALYCYENDGIDLEDAFQEACIGLVMSIKKYNDDVEGLFPSYASMWMVQVMHRNLPYYQYNCRMPVHYLEYVVKIMKELSANYGEVNLEDINIDYLQRVLFEYTECDKRNAVRMAPILALPISIEEIRENESYLSIPDYDETMKMERMISMETVNDLLSILNDREKEIIVRRLGFAGYQEQTLDEIGQVLSVTRERIRQIEKKAKLKMAKHLYSQHLITRKQYRSIVPKKSEKPSTRIEETKNGFVVKL